MEKLNQHKRPRTSKRKLRGKSEANRENSRLDLPGPVSSVKQTGLTGGNQKTPENLDSNYESQPNDHENR